MKKIKIWIEKIKKNDFYNKLLKNFSFATIGEGGASLINLIVIVLLIKLIGNNGYAILTLSQSYMLIMDGIINLQCWKSVIKYGEECYSKNDMKSLKEYIKLGTILDVSTAILGFIVCFFMINVISIIFKWDATLISSAKIFSFVILFHFTGTSTAILRMENKFNLVSIQKIATALLKVIVLFIFIKLYSEISILNAVIIYALADILGNLTLAFMAMYQVHKKLGIKNTIKSNKSPKWKDFTKFTIWTTLSDIVDIPVQYFDVFIISKLNLELVSVFKFFKQIVAILSKLTTPLYQAIFPQFSSLVANSKENEGYKLVLKIKKVILKLMIPMSLFIGLTSPVWLKMIFGSLYANKWYVLTLYLLLQSLALSYTTIHPYFVALGEVYYSFKYVLISNIVYVIISLILVNIIGMTGIVLAYGVQFMIVIYLKKRRIEKILEVNNEK